MKFASLVITLTVLGCVATATAELNSDGLWRTFAPNALMGKATPLPLSAEEAESAGWVKKSECVEGLGYKYSNGHMSPCPMHPLSLFFTEGGQIAGVEARIYGHGDFLTNRNIGAAAQPELVSKGFWQQEGDKEEWYITVSFRAPGLMCSGKTTADTVGDRAVINQNLSTLPGHSYALPKTVPEAIKNKYAPGSCMKTMGQHYFKDLATGPDMSWVEGNLMPVIPMFYPPGPTGKLHAFFFATPVVQFGSNLAGTGDWESPFLPVFAMCQNWCDDGCTTKKTNFWSTMHIYLNSQWDGLTCPEGSGPFGRSCPGTSGFVV